MAKTKLILRALLFLALFCSAAYADEDAIEKKAQSINAEIQALRDRLQNCYLQSVHLLAASPGNTVSAAAIQEIRHLKNQIVQMEEKWRKSSIKEGADSESSYAFWDLGDATLSQLLMEYGSSEYLYVIPQEMGSLKINLFSMIGIPQEAWSEMIESILQSNGIGLKKVNPFLRQLYFFKHDPSYIEAIVSSKEQLQLVSDLSRVAYVFAPAPEQIKATQSFFEGFSDPKQTTIQAIGTKLLILTSKQTMERLLDLYDVIWRQGRGKTAHVYKLSKLNVVEAEKIVRSYFLETSVRSRPSFAPNAPEEIQIFPLPQGNAVVLIGSAALIERAEKMLSDLEGQMEDPQEMTIFWYTAKHSDPQDIAAVLEKVYSSLTVASLPEGGKPVEAEPLPAPRPQIDMDTAMLPVSPPMALPGQLPKSVAPKSFGNFIVDPKSGSILMTVRKADLDKINALLKKLDAPKKMVQIEVLLVEKRMHDREQSGFNLLKLGGKTDASSSILQFNGAEDSPRKGILDFILQKPAGKWPALDLTLSFLMSQEDITINASPSIIAINQTPASISIVEELSINNGVVQTGDRNMRTEKSFTRAQFGILISMTPTIHLPDEQEEESRGFITLQTNITFDTAQASADDRPPVTRRHIENEVCIADGETIILGGLRRLSGEDSREKVPFLGEIPGIGKLFGSTKISGSSTEMFIFITPHIIKNPGKDLVKCCGEPLIKRPGELPEFLRSLQEAKKSEKKKLFEKSLQLLFEKP